MAFFPRRIVHEGVIETRVQIVVVCSCLTVLGFRQQFFN
jgi:hypothetical protein